VAGGISLFSIQLIYSLLPVVIICDVMKRSKVKEEPLTIGIISDTHGLLRPEAEDALQDVGLIIHAGDIGSPRIMEQLQNIAPLVAVRGNMDSEDWAYKLNMTEIIEKNNVLMYLIHDLSRIDLDPTAAKIRIVISGHTHRASISSHNGVLYVNPGSAGPRRFRLPVTAALLRLDGTLVDANIITLNV